MKNEPIRTLGIERDWHAKPNSSFVPHFKVHKLVDDFGTAKKYRTISQPKPRTRKPRATRARRLIAKQVANFQEPTDRGLALAEKRTREFYATESTGFELTLSLLRR